MSQPVIIKNKPLYLWLDARPDPSVGVYFALIISIRFFINFFMSVEPFMHLFHYLVQIVNLKIC